MRFRRAIFFLFPALAWPQAAGVLTHESDTQFILDRGVPAIPYLRPFWSGSQLINGPVAASRELVLIVTPADGRNEEVRFQMDGWRNLHAVGAWGGYDGSIVLAGSGTEEDGTGSPFIGWIAPDHKTRRIAKIDLSPSMFTVEPSGVVVAIASNSPNPPEEHSDTILARFDPTGKTLTSRKLQIRSFFAQGSIMIASATRISWLTNTNSYYEFSMDGSLVYQAQGPPPGGYSGGFETRMAVSLGGTVLVSRPVREKQRVRTAVYALDRLHQSWYQPEIAKGSPAPDEIYGFDSDTLVTTALVRDLGQVLRRYRLSDK